MLSILMSKADRCDSRDAKTLLALIACYFHSGLVDIFALLCTVAEGLSALFLSNSVLFDVNPPSLLSIYLFNLKQTKLFAFINA